MKDLEISLINVSLLFIITQLFAIVLLPLFPVSYQAFPGQENNPLLIIYFIVSLIAVTAFILFLARKHLDKIIRYMFYLVIFLAFLYVIPPILYYINIPFSEYLSFIIPIVIIFLVIVKPEWYIVDTVGVIAGAGVAVIIGMSLGVLPAILLLIVFAIYDALAVYKTKHMVSLAETVVSNKVPALFVIPKSSEFSYGSDSKLSEDTERGAFYLGYGDAIIPAVLMISSMLYLNIFIGFTALFGSIVGLIFLLIQATKGKPQAGLPFLNTGALCGFFIGYIIFIIL
jgi:presenilin-like A22 family membrane protease